MDWLAWLPHDPTLRLASLIACLLVAVTLAMLVQVLATSMLAARRKRQRDAFNNQWRPRLAQMSLEGAVAGFDPPRGKHRRWWLLLWNRMQRQLRGTASLRLNELIPALALDGYALSLLRGRSVRGKLVALETFRHLGDETYWNEIVPLCRGGNPFVTFAAAQALIAMDPERAIRQVLPQALERENWGAQRLSALCRQAGRVAVTPALLEALEQAGPTRLARLTPLLAQAEPARIAPWARARAVNDGDARNRAAALQALGELGDPVDKKLILQALHDADPSVRLVAVEALHKRADIADLDVLLALLADHSWWVRRQAADTIATLPRLDADALRALLPGVQDKYGHEALARALAERFATGQRA